MGKATFKPGKNSRKGNTGKSSTSKKGAKKEFSRSPGRATKQKGKKMIIPVDTVMRKIGTVEPHSVRKPKAKLKAKAPVVPPHSLCLALHEVEKHGTGVLSFPVEKLAKAIRNAYKGAKAGTQEARIIERIRPATRHLNLLGIAHALVASGIPAHRAGKVAMEWDSLSTGAPQSMFGGSEKIRQLVDRVVWGLQKEETRQGEDWENMARAFLDGIHPNLPHQDRELLLRRALEVKTRREAITRAYAQDKIEKRKRIAEVLSIILEMNPLPTLKQSEALFSGIPEKERAEIVETYVSAFTLSDRGALDQKRRAHAKGYIGSMCRLSPAEEVQAVREAEAKELGSEIGDLGEGSAAAEQKARVSKREVIATGLISQDLAEPTGDKAAALPKTAEDCLAYVKDAFDSADPDCIADDTGYALFRAWPIWAPGSNILSGRDLLRAVDIPAEWHTAIVWAASDAQRNTEEIAREEEIERREQTRAPAAAEAPNAKASEGGGEKGAADLSKSINLEDILGNFDGERFRQAYGALEAVIHGAAFTMEAAIPQDEWDGAKGFHPIASALRSAFYDFNNRLRPILRGDVSRVMSSQGGG